MDAKGWVELVSALTMPLALGLLVLRSWFTEIMFGPLTIQFAGLSVLVPLILILGLEKILDAAIVGTLVGGIAGYAIGGMAHRPKDPGEH